MSNEVTYSFRDDKIYAIHNGKVIAAGTDSDAVEQQVKLAFGGPPEGMNPAHMQPDHGHGEVGYAGRGELPMGGMPDSGFQEPTRECHECGNPNVRGEMCEHCGAPQGRPGMDQMDMEPQGYDGGDDSPYGEMGYGRQGRVITPNGLTGTVLGKVASVWGPEVTIRLENGRIVKLPVGTELRSVRTAATKKATPIEQLEARLASTTDGTRDGLVARSQALETIKQQASSLIREGVAHADSIRLDQLVVTADVEQQTIFDAVTHIDEADSYTPPSFTMQAAARTSSASKEDASWLDHTLDEMIKEAEATDFTKLMDEGPESLAAELADSALADQEVTREIASSFISEKTAGIDRKVANPYMETFLGRVEQCRLTEISNRTQVTQKEAAVTEDQYKDFPDDSLFL